LKPFELRAYMTQAEIGQHICDYNKKATFTYVLDRGSIKIETFDSKLIQYLMRRGVNQGRPTVITFDAGMSKLEEARYLLGVGKNSESIAKALEIIEELQNK